MFNIIRIIKSKCIVTYICNKYKIVSKEFEMLLNVKELICILLFDHIISQTIQQNNLQLYSPLTNQQQLSVLQYPISNNLISQQHSISVMSYTLSSHHYQCQCQNQGKCYTIVPFDPNIQNRTQKYCNCSRSFIGQMCQQQAEQIIFSKQIFKFINIYQYKYFYYEPIQESMFSFTFHLCFDSRYYKKNNDSGLTLENSVTFFLNTEDQDGKLQLTQQENDPITVQLQENQCKYITVDYTMFVQTKLKTIQKFIVAMKLGKPLNNLVPDQCDPQIQYCQQRKNLKKSERALKYNITTKINDKNFTSNLTKRNVTGGHYKNRNATTFRRVYLNFSIQPFVVSEVFQQIIYSLITLTAFLIIAILVFILRTRVLGLRITESFSQNGGLSNDLKHFERYLPEQLYIRSHNQIGQNHLVEVQIDCAICIVNLEHGQSIRRTPCDHIFHKGCIDSWCVQNLTCPICRRSLTQSKIKQLYSSSMQLSTNSDSND